MQVNTKIDQYFVDALRLLSGKIISVLQPTPTTREEFETQCRALVNDEWVYGQAGLGVTFQQVKTKATELEETYNAQEYARNRSAEYPPITDYIDGVVKGDQSQIDAYVSACLAVKAKYPKPE